MSGPKRQLTCACCGSDAGKWHQHFNQDTGYGVCARCRDWIQARGMDPGEFRQTYGKPGVNYEANKSSTSAGCSRCWPSSRSKTLQR